MCVFFLEEKIFDVLIFLIKFNVILLYIGRHEIVNCRHFNNLFHTRALEIYYNVFGKKEESFL